MESTNENPDFIKFYNHFAEIVCRTITLAISSPLTIFANPEQRKAMKKILITLVLLLVLVLAAVYLFIPGKIKIETSISLNAALPGVSRSLMDENNWKKWWPGESVFNYNKQTYSIR